MAERSLALSFDDAKGAPVYELGDGAALVGAHYSIVPIPHSCQCWLEGDVEQAIVVGVPWAVLDVCTLVESEEERSMLGGNIWD